MADRGREGCTPPSPAGATAWALRTPQPLARQLALDEGTTVTLRVEDGRLVLQPLRKLPRLDELLAGITPENLPDERFDDAGWAEKWFNAS